MIYTYPSKAIEEEAARMAEIWAETGESLDEVVEKYASSEYKRYYFKEQERRKRLWDEEGIIEE